jgi:para-aminobenzoate synthetase component 1
LRQELDAAPDRLAAVIGTWREPALLEGGSGFRGSGGWGILTAEPRLVFEATDEGWRVISRDRGRIDSGHCDPLAALGRLLDRYGLGLPGVDGDRMMTDPTSPSFRGGMIGYLSYDLAPWLERLPRRHAAASRMPLIRMGLHDIAVVVDNLTGIASLMAWDILGEGEFGLRRRFELWKNRIKTGLANLRDRRASVVPTAELVSTWTRDQYLAAARRVVEYIAAGDIFQANLSQRFSLETRVDPLTTYTMLKQTSPAPFGAFLRWDDFAVVSASPEWFYQTAGDRVVTRPIKGTRPRGVTPAEDERLAAELVGSAKDRAELTMIVDLERNDLGRVCEYGSVVVKDALRVESFAQVHHLVATVEGRLRPGIGPIELIRAVFPGGSITGAPKIRAMEIIDELEPNRRGLYTGAIGYLSRAGSSAFNIAIRTILIEGRQASFQVGGGIVADSDPEAEYEETLTKGQGLRAVLEGQGSIP